MSKDQYLKQFNENKNGPLHGQKWVIEELKEFYSSLKKFDPFFATIVMNYGQLNTKDTNDIIPGHHLLTDDIKKCFFDLTMIEEMYVVGNWLLANVQSPKTSNDQKVPTAKNYQRL
ncbi:hypothetical protein BpHYR1_012319 [Brachionus plicatilis]|uniref:Uncharacterized protein n=1 Tax=Brachionus plicatilis TaxID=10195 RepID=A0A3M7R6U9_BRAPC|nr:hypothetical protein BpHYR1_012319 [Brachionus plicatilis]